MTPTTTRPKAYACRITLASGERRTQAVIAQGSSAAICQLMDTYGEALRGASAKPMHQTTTPTTRSH